MNPTSTQLYAPPTSVEENGSSLLLERACASLIKSPTSLNPTFTQLTILPPPVEENNSFLWLQHVCSQLTTVSEVAVTGAESSVLVCQLDNGIYSLANSFHPIMFFGKSQSLFHLTVRLMEEMIGINYATSSHLHPTSQITCCRESAMSQVLRVLGKEFELPFEIFLNHYANGIQLIIKNSLSDTLVRLCIKFCYTNSAVSADDLSLPLIDNNTRYDCTSVWL